MDKCEFRNAEIEIHALNRSSNIIDQILADGFIKYAADLPWLFNSDQSWYISDPAHVSSQRFPLETTNNPL